MIKRNARFDPVTRRRETNSYSFAGLIDAAGLYAKEALVEKERRKAESAARIRRKAAGQRHVARAGETAME